MSTLGSDPNVLTYCGKTLRRRQVYNKKIQWLCSTYIEKGVKACKGIRIDDAELQGLNIAEQTVVEEMIRNGKKYYSYRKTLGSDPLTIFLQSFDVLETCVAESILNLKLAEEPVLN